MTSTTILKRRYETWDTLMTDIDEWTLYQPGRPRDMMDMKCDQRLSPRFMVQRSQSKDRLDIVVVVRRLDGKKDIRTVFGRTGFIHSSTLLGSCADLITYRTTISSPYTECSFQYFWASLGLSRIARAYRHTAFANLTSISKLQEGKDGQDDHPIVSFLVRCWNGEITKRC